MTKYNEYAIRYRTHFLSQAQTVARAISAAYANNANPGDATQAFTALQHSGTAGLRDAWNTEFTFEHVPWDREKSYYMLRSAGPDKQFNTGDDLITYLQVRRAKIVGHPDSGPSKIDLHIDPDRGPANGRAEVTGTVVDQWGGALQGAIIQMRSTSSRRWRVATANAQGQFRLAALPSGDYEIAILTGTERITQKLMLNPRDRATVSVMLRLNAPDVQVTVNEDSETSVTVEATGAAPVMVMNGVVGGVPGGVAGGVIGGVIGGPINGREAFALKEDAAPRAMALQVAKTQARNSAIVTKDENGSSASPAAHVRSYFPEALYINPEIVTDADGRASIVIPVADSITHMAHGHARLHRSWRARHLDLQPESLPRFLCRSRSSRHADARRSRISPCRRLQLLRGSWRCKSETSIRRLVLSGRRRSRQNGQRRFCPCCRIAVHPRSQAHRKVQADAVRPRMQGAANRADIVVREIDVIPNGREQNVVFNGRLENEVQHEIAFPSDSIPDASKIFVRLYPGPLSQVIEGMDSLLRMPFGCFEQTSSSTYPNVLALDYMKRTKKLTPEVHAKAEGYIANGYQRHLLTFEVASGGFSWFGSAPRQQDTDCLRTYGVLRHVAGP